MGSSWDRADEFEEEERQEAKRKHEAREKQDMDKPSSWRSIRKAEEILERHRRVNDTQSRLDDIFSSVDLPKGLSDKDILAIAGNVDTCPLFPWWLGEGVDPTDVRKRTIIFARAILEAAKK